jgi:hypothetical protein
MESENEGDDYERAYMSDENVRFRDKLVAPKLFHGMMGISSIGLFGASVAAVFMGGDPFAAGVLMTGAVASVGGWGLFSGLRITVTDEKIMVQYGLFGPTIPLDSIESIESVDYHWVKAGGFGIRLGLDGSIVYNMMGDRGKAVKIVWKNKYGIKRKHVLSSTNPDAMVAAIEDARRARTASDYEQADGAPVEESLSALRSAQLSDAVPQDLMLQKDGTNSEQEQGQSVELENHK